MGLVVPVDNIFRFASFKSIRIKLMFPKLSHLIGVRLKALAVFKKTLVEMLAGIDTIAV